MRALAAMSSTEGQLLVKGERPPISRPSQSQVLSGGQSVVSRMSSSCLVDCFSGGWQLGGFTAGLPRLSCLQVEEESAGHQEDSISRQGCAH